MIRVRFFGHVAFMGALISMLMAAISPMANAHHASSPHFDHSKSLKMRAIFAELKLVNPHAYIYFDVEEGGEAARWRCEMRSATQLRRQGWSEDMLRPGEPFLVNGAPARREDNVCVVSSLIFEDGQIFNRTTDLTGRGVSSYNSVRDERASFEGRAKALKNGQPNISGNWRTVSFGWSSPMPYRRSPYRLTDAGEEARAGYDMIYDDPILRCHYVNLISGWNTDAHVNRIAQEGGKIRMTYGFMDVERVIHLDKKAHPKKIVPTDTGYSIGRWEGDELIIDTIGFEPGLLNSFSGIKHSDQLRVQERFKIDSETNYLLRNYRFTDPVYLKGPVEGSDGQELVNLDYTPFNCTELSGANNIRPGEQPEYFRGTGIKID